MTVEVRETSPAHYLLKIESFSLLSESDIKKFESNEFEAGGYKWKMIIYPDGNARENGSEHISVYLAISGTSSLLAGWEVNAIFTFFLFNQLRDNYLSVRALMTVRSAEKMRRFQPIKSLWGHPKFLSHETFKEASNGYLVDDKCVIGAEIFVVQRQSVGECLSMVKYNDSFKCEWKICNFSNLGKDWFSEEFTVGGYKWKLWLNPKDCMWLSTSSPSWGYQGFLPLTQLHGKKNGYLVNDCIVVEVDLEVVFKHSVKSLS
ncbi:BTB/POZ and MATH domain-containing protein 2-like [Lycium barbarum]|uniref:BTB/POZ and MATH domain-containing protein 2-like n=1 Tax=Lycium barbarum TaxID=112863 RepID=UPI00293EC1C3|nr:BTB/POZ and MATH domain-containing protein 2-like [Lycium barbarum]